MLTFGHKINRIWLQIIKALASQIDNQFRYFRKKLREQERGICPTLYVRGLQLLLL